MKKLFFVLIFPLFFGLSCSSNSIEDNNPNLLPSKVNYLVHLSLPQFTNLQFGVNAVYLSQEIAGGNGGIILVNTGNTYVAYDAADPNHRLKDCSILQIDGMIGECGCEDHFKYNLISGTPVEGQEGQEELKYALRPYQVIDNGNGTLTIKN